MELIDCLTDEDKKTIKDWIEINKECKISSVEDVLRQWNKNKRTMFSLLGKQLRVKIPIEQEVDSSTFFRRMEEIYTMPAFYSEKDTKHIVNVSDTSCEFLDSLLEYLSSAFTVKHKYENIKFSDFEIKEFDAEYTYFHNLNSFFEPYCKCFSTILKTLFNHTNIADNILRYDYSFKLEGKKILKLPKGMKAMKGIQKFLNYIEFPSMYLFQDWRNDISDLTTQKIIKANLVFSIHPIDLLTLSDNNCGWTSCVRMTCGKGIYHETITEILNSNCAIVVYLESNHKKFMFNFNSIPNKSWRQIVYCNKNIIVTGKSYPYTSNDLAEKTIQEVRKLAKDNLHWKYMFGPQSYLDMTSYYEKYNIGFVEKFNNKKKILLYHAAYYNDMIYDHEIDYICVRNPVQKTKRISLSGPATCFCCGEKLVKNLRKEAWESTSQRIKNMYNNGFCSSCTRLKCEEQIKDAGRNNNADSNSF